MMNKLRQVDLNIWMNVKSITKPSRLIDITEALELMSKGELTQSGYDLSFLVVIEPKLYDMSKGQIFFNDFAVTFTSTNEKIRDDVAAAIKGWLADNTTRMFIHINLDDFKKHLQELSRKEASDSQTNLFKDVLHSHLCILLMNADVISTFSYDINTDVEDFFWTYVGTQKLDIQQIKQKFDAKVDLLSEGKCRTRKSFMTVVSERQVIE